MPDGPSTDDLRQEMARYLEPSAFPADGDRLLATAADKGASDEVTQRLARLPIDREFESVDDVLAALDEP
jgi:hypothetical protein